MEESHKADKNDTTDAKKMEDTVDTFPFSFGKKSVPVNIHMSREEFEADIYPMNRKNRGFAVIINNKTFDSVVGLGARNGTDVDASALANRFAELGFDVELEDDVTTEEMLQIMKKYAYMDHSENDCFVCAILSHGEEGIVYGKNGKIEIKKLLEPFKGNLCETLAGKPKVFFIQACRGTEFDEGVEMNVADAKGEMDVDRQISTHKIPAEADFLVAYSVVPGYYAWRNSIDGSWFVQALSTVLEKYGSQLDLVRVLTRVNKLVAYKFQSNTSNPYMSRKKQIPCITSMLTKELYFYPKQ
ncbi:CASP7 [Mytilus coruscus]|uniref:CASP7 n=1 Tax=Mytilus coruscus TaxID=42192 RepID=A0A6J8B3J9_MYTCO|nr:CASP7 [Mytilus coruscus]